MKKICLIFLLIMIAVAQTNSYAKTEESYIGDMKYEFTDYISKCSGYSLSKINEGIGEFKVYSKYLYQSDYSSDMHLTRKLDDGELIARVDFECPITCHSYGILCKHEAIKTIRQASHRTEIFVFEYEDEPVENNVSSEETTETVEADSQDMITESEEADLYEDTEEN